MENLTKHWRNLSLNEREGGKLAVKKDRANQEFTLVAKFLTKRVLNNEAIVRTFSPLWQAKNGLKSEMQTNIQCYLCLIMQKK